MSQSHSLVVGGPEDRLTLIVLEGVIQYLDDDDKMSYQDDIFTKMKRHLDFCKAQNIEPLSLSY
jgi:2,4'-dihydroxyacetophenone dioxygenase